MLPCLLRSSSAFTVASVTLPSGSCPTDFWKFLIAVTVFAPISPSGTPASKPLLLRIAWMLRIAFFMVEKEGRFGRKNSKGFYDYPPKPAKKSLWPDLKTFYPQKQADEVDVNVLKQRFLVTIALEAARTVEEGIVTDPREADVGSILGFGFAPYTGGALSYIDGMGAKAFVELAEKLADAYGSHFKPTPLLKDMP